MYEDDDESIPISALQHALFCERQFALIHLEGIWAENRYTAEGRVLHERVDVTRHESRRLFRQEFGLSVRSERLGLTGRCDLVEIRLAPDGAVAEAVPVEFKRGRRKESDIDRVQLCAQGLCLEEMFGLPVPRGEFYYLQEHRRSEEDISGEVRARTEQQVKRIRDILASRTTPVAEYQSRKCDSCSLLETCMPKSAGVGAKRTERYIAAQILAARKE